MNVFIMISFLLLEELVQFLLEFGIELKVISDVRLRHL